MLVRITRMLACSAMLSAGSVSLFAQAAQPDAAQAQQGQAAGQAAGQAPAAAGQKNWKDRAEYDLYESITKEQNATKQLELLNQWKEKYAQTDFVQERLLLYLNAYQRAGQPAKMIEVAKEILAKDPKDVTALYWITFLTPSLNNRTPDALETGEKGARGLIENLDTMFSAAKKPQTTNDEQWKKARTDTEAVAYKTLGWVAMIRNNVPQAQEFFQKSLQANAAAGEVSYWLGQTIASTKNVELYSSALYHFARAASFDAPGSLPPEGRKQVLDYFQKAYTQFHGSKDGLDQVLTQAKMAPLPPAGFKIPSKAELAAEQMKKDEEFKKQNPQLALWMNLKQELQGPNGAEYFKNGMQGAGLPKLKGKLVSQNPPVRPKELVLALSDDTTPEVTLVLETPLPGKAEAGTVLEFEGVGKSFSAQPFMVTMDVEREKLSGWPAASAPAKRAAPAKRRR